MINRRVVAVILEGHSDRLTFEGAFEAAARSFEPSGEAIVLVFRGDITINNALGEPIDSNDVLDNVRCFIMNEIRSLRLNPEDLLCIIHIGDLDAAFCDEEQVRYFDQKRPFYDVSQAILFTKNVSETLKRNATKKDALIQLMQCDKIELNVRNQILYRYFYVSINLEHAFYGKANCTAKEKEEYGLDASGKAISSIDSWRRFIEGLPCRGETYEESYIEARKQGNAFAPMTNLRFVFEFLQKAFQVK